MDKRAVTIVDSYGADNFGIPSISIYFSHCDKKELTGTFCAGCHNKELQKDGVGHWVTAKELIKALEQKLRFQKKLTGKTSLVFLGGEPTSYKNIEFVKKIARHFHDILENVEMVMYTWKLPEQLDDELVSLLDKVVCGEYVHDLKSDNYILGSTNQFVIDNKKNIILKYEEE